VSKPNAKSSLWTVPAKLSPFYKWFIVIFLVSVYAISFPWIFEQLGDPARLFMFIFVIPVVLFWGFKGGVIIALLSSLAMIIFYQVSGEKFSGGAIGPLFLFVIVIIIGRMRDLSLQLEEELTKRDQAEIELIEHQANLKKMIKERTIELSRANSDLQQEISERKQDEIALVNAKNQWEKTFNAVWDWVSIIDQNHRIIRSNKACKNFIDLPIEQVIGKSCYQLVHGMECPISDCPMERAFKSKQRENMEIQLVNGRWIMISVDPIKSGNSNELFVHIVRDITEIKKKETEILNARKAEAFSILSGGIAHDYNNLLSVIWGNISLLKEDITDALQQEFIEDAEKACKQARTLTHQFITLSKGAMFKKGLHPIENILGAVIEKVENKNKVTISLNIQDRIPPIEVDPDYLMIAFENIIQNGLDAMAGKGQLEIRAKIESIISKDQKRPKCFKISVKDSGKGICKSDLINVLDPYFTTKEMGKRKGSGLGLAVSKSIIKKHGGDIRIESIVGRGTTVIVSLPLQNE